MYYSDGNAAVGNRTPPNATNAGQVSSIPGSSGPMVGNPTANATVNGTSKPPCQNQQLLFVPGQDPTDHQMGFTQNATSNQIITKFIWYGHFSLVESDSGKYTSLFYAKKTEHDDVLSLQWNITDEDDEGDFISISMPGLPPSNA